MYTKTFALWPSLAIVSAAKGTATWEEDGICGLRSRLSPLRRKRASPATSSSTSTVAALSTRAEMLRTFSEIG